MKPRCLFTAAALLAATTLSSPATIYFFDVPLDGAQEAPNPGDPDGTGRALLYFDDVALSVAWDITVQDIAPFTVDHIHNAPAGAGGPVRIDFMSSLSGFTVDPDVALLLADPTQWYVNVHNGDFPGGAVRGQLPAVPTAIIPEASTWLGIVGLGALGAGHCAWRRMRRVKG